jgi:hypothetical protein
MNRIDLFENHRRRWANEAGHSGPWPLCFTTPRSHRLIGAGSLSGVGHTVTPSSSGAPMLDGRCLEKQAQRNVDAVAIVEP